MSCTSSQIEYQLIAECNFKKEVADKYVGLYTLKNENGMIVQITNYGARVVALWAPDKDGNFQDVVWGFESIDEYLNSNDIYCCPIVGRFGNRINKGQFELDSIKYQLTINNGINHLHGGTKGWECKVWDAEKITVDDHDAVKLSYFSKDGEEGYPGNLTIEVTYILTNNNELTIKYEAKTDASTIINPTSHCYFNLSGTSKNSILSHVLKINADHFTPTDSGLIPTGEIKLLDNTPLDFRELTGIGKRIEDDYEPLKYGLGYDHNYVLKKALGEYSEAALVYSPQTGISMAVLTDQPGLQFYSGNFMDGSIKGKRGNINKYRSGIALEAQNFPDAPNHDNFPSAILRPGQKYTQTTTYAFSIFK